MYLECPAFDLIFPSCEEMNKLQSFVPLMDDFVHLGELLLVGDSLFFVECLNVITLLDQFLETSAEENDLGDAVASLDPLLDVFQPG